MPPTTSKLQNEVTQILQKMQDGDKKARDQLIELVYPELRKLAARYFRGERGNHTLQPTALANEAYLRLVGIQRIQWQNRAHFYAVMARLMRQTLVDHARKRNADKRGGGVTLVDIDGLPVAGKGQSIDLLALDQALERLHEQYPRAAQVVELRDLLGLKEEETADMLNIGGRTARKHLQVGRAFLRAELAGAPRTKPAPSKK